MFFEVLVLEFATDGLPKVAQLLGYLVAEHALRTRAFLVEEGPNLDAEDFFVLADGSLVVEQNHRLPSQLLAQAKHAQCRLQLSQVALEPRYRLHLDFPELLKTVLVKGREPGKVLLQLCLGDAHAWPQEYERNDNPSRGIDQPFTIPGLRAALTRHPTGRGWQKYQILLRWSLFCICNPPCYLDGDLTLDEQYQCLLLNQR